MIADDPRRATNPLFNANPVKLAAAGLDSTLLTSESSEDRVPPWMQSVMPLLVQAGLRLPG